MQRPVAVSRLSHLQEANRFWICLAWLNSFIMPVMPAYGTREPEPMDSCSKIRRKNDFYDRVSRMVEMLSNTPLRNFWISLDSSVDETHEKMRGFKGIVAGIAKALPTFHQAGIYPAVNLGINRNVGGGSTRHLRRIEAATNEAYLEAFYHRYLHAFERFYQKAIDLGFTMANTCYPMSIDITESSQGLSAVYAATTVDDIVRFAPDEKRMLFKALITTIKRFRSKLRIFLSLAMFSGSAGSSIQQ